MTNDPFLPFMKEVTNMRDELEKLLRRVEEVNALENSSPNRDVSLRFRSWVSVSLEDILDRELCYLYRRISHCSFAMAMLYRRNLNSLISEEGQPLRIGRRRATINLLSFVYLYLTGYIDRGGSKASSSGSLDFRDIYISILLFRAAYIWIKFRDVIPRGAVYRRPGSNKWEPRIAFPMTRGEGGKSKRIPLGSYNSSAEGEVVYQIAVFYCKKLMHRLGRLDLGRGAYFPIPTLSVDPNLPYEEKVKQVGVQVLRVYAAFKERKASRNRARNLLPSVPGPAFEMQTSPIQQLQQPLNSRMDSAIQGQGSQLGPNIRNGIKYIDLLLLFSKIQFKLLKPYKQLIIYLKVQVSRPKVETKDLILELELEILELEREVLELKREIWEMEREKGLLN